jgi:ABC-type amino acid transport substrate-binding protein
MKTYLLFLGILLIGCQNKQSADQLVLCTNSTYPPYESIDANGNSVGFDIDMAEAIAKQLKKKLRINELPFDSMILTLQQNKCDFLMSGMSITPSRQKEITLIPYQRELVKSYYLLFWKKEPVGFEQLKNKTIAVQAGTWMEDYLNTLPSVTPKALDSTPELILEIQYNKSAASFVEPHIAKDLLLKQPDIKGIEISLPESEWRRGNGIGLKKSNTKLAEEIQTALDHIKQSGLLKELEKKWLHKK